MARIRHPGEPIDYVVTFLEMTERPPARPEPPAQDIRIVEATNPPVDYFLYLYTTVGAEHEWTDQLQRPRAELQDFVGNPKVSLYSLILDGWPGGFFMLDSTRSGVCDLAYFGLVPHAVGRSLGRWFLTTAVQTGWDRPGITKMTVNTNTLDHPRALGLYESLGFRKVRTQDHTRILTRERIEAD